MSIVCVDIGTTRCKIATIAANGSLLSESAFPHHAQLPENEIDCEAIFQSIEQELQKLFSQFHDIEGITTTSFGETLVCTDSEGLALSPSILYFDTRSPEAVARVRQTLGEQAIYQKTGHRLGSISPLATLCRMQEYQTTYVQQASTLLFVADYILVRLGASPFLSKSFAVTSNWMDYSGESLWPEALDTVGIPAQKLPPVRDAGAVVGTLSAALCKRWKTTVPPKLIAGGHDQPFATMGAGAIHAQEAVYGMGTSDSLNLILPAPVLHEGTYQYGYSCEQYFNTSKYLTFAQIPSGGKSLTWAYNLLFPSVDGFSFAACEKDIQESITLQNDVLFFPLINGSGTPFSQIPAAGSFWGLTDKTTPHHMLLAVLEGVSFEMKFNLELLKNCGIECSRIIASGGGAQFEDWLQLRADILQMPLFISECKNTGILGLFAISSVTLGYFSSPEDAVQSSNPIHDVKQPRSEKASYYAQKYEKYKEIRTFIQKDLNTYSEVNL